MINGIKFGGMSKSVNLVCFFVIFVEVIIKIFIFCELQISFGEKETPATSFQLKYFFYSTPPVINFTCHFIARHFNPFWLNIEGLTTV